MTTMRQRADPTSAVVKILEADHAAFRDIDTDPLATDKRLARLDTRVAEVVGARIFGSELPRKQVSEELEPSMVVRDSGGGSIGDGARGRSQWNVTRVDITSYGKNPREAGVVHWAVYDLLTQIERVAVLTQGENALNPNPPRVQDPRFPNDPTRMVKYLFGSIIHDAIVTGGPIDGRDNDTGWPYVVGVYDVSSMPFSIVDPPSFIDDRGNRSDLDVRNGHHPHHSTGGCRKPAH